MRIALIGHGAMGRLVSAHARAEGHEIGLIWTSANTGQSVDDLTGQLSGHDVAIDFSVGPAVLKHATACAHATVPLVEGTTGWKAQESEVRQVVMTQGGALVYGANFSIGVNLFYRIIQHAAELFSGLEDYEAFIEEIHHRRKRDAPSGTALRLREVLSARLEREVPIASTRAGYVPGTHRVGFDSRADQITLTHTARSREGFARGALRAAQWIVGRRGVFGFSEMFDEILREEG